MSANDTQIGGNHYKVRIEHWDFISDNGIGYLEACAVKYVTRWPKKDGLKDLKKAKHFVQKLIEKQIPLQAGASMAAIAEYCLANSLKGKEAEIVTRLCGPWNEENFKISLDLVEGLIAGAPEEDPVITTANKVVEAINECDVQTALTVLSNVVGHCIVTLGGNIPTDVQSHLENFGTAVSVAANNKMLYDSDAKGNG